MSYSTPMIVLMAGIMIVIAVLAGVEPWMLGIGAAIALVMFFVERRRA